MTGLTYYISQGTAIGLTQHEGQPSQYDIYVEDDGFSVNLRVTRDQVRKIMDVFGDVLRWSEES